jgi:hypothetical protein
MSIIGNFSGALYEKETLLQWGIPDACKEFIRSNSAPYFFLNCSKAEDQGIARMNLNVFPSPTASVFALEVKLKKIMPEILHKTLTMLRDKGCKILTSTGICTQADLCLFGVFFSSPCEFKKEEFHAALNAIAEVLGVELVQFSINGCISL